MIYSESEKGEAGERGRKFMSVFQNNMQEKISQSFKIICKNKFLSFGQKGEEGREDTP